MKGKGKAIPTKGKNSREARAAAAAAAATAAAAAVEAGRERDSKSNDWDQGRREDDQDKDEKESGCGLGPGSASWGDAGVDLKDCPLQFPDFSPIDHTRACPKYNAILQREEDEGVGLEDLDSLQLELESLLSSVSKRMRQLETEMQILITWQEKKEVKKPGGGKANPQCTGKHGKSQDERHSKKMRGDGSGKASSSGSHSTPGPGRPKSKNAKIQEHDIADPSTEAPRVPKNDAPNRFWVSVEPYCSDITTDDVKLLEELVKSHEEDSEYYKIPSLGKHYSIKWAQEDMLEEQKESAKINDKRRGLSNSSNLNSSEAEKLLKKAERECDDNSSPFGSLTQRLVSCLIEENIITSMDDAMSGAVGGCAGGESVVEGVSPPTGAVALNKVGLIKSLNITNASQLERRIKRELEEQGILEVEEHVGATQENPEDDILAELKRCQAELRAVTAYNLQAQRRLLKLAREDMAKQELRKKLQVADAEIMDAYRRITAARQKKKTPTKKEKDLAWKALRERGNIIKALSNSHVST